MILFFKYNNDVLRQYKKKILDFYDILHFMLKNDIWGPYYVMIDTVSFFQNIQNIKEL